MNKGFFKLIAILLFFFCFSILDVRAESANLSLVCDKREVVVLNSITCDVTFNGDANINNISFSMDGEGLSLSFKAIDGFTNNSDSTSVSIHKDGISSGKIGTLEINALGSVSEGEKVISLSNIIMGNSEDVNINFKQDPVNQTIKVISNKSNNNKLKDLQVNDVTLHDFDPSKNVYDIIVNDNKIKISAVSDHLKAQIKIGDNNSLEQVLAVGDNKIDIIVTAENDDVNVYTLNVKYEIPKSDDNTLKTLELYFGEEKIDFYYDITKTVFNINVDSDVDNLTIKSTLNDDKASYVKKYENRDVVLKYGDNKIELRVMAEDKQVRSYILNITREDDRNNNKTLDKLIVNGEAVVLSSSIFEYRVNVRYKYERSEIVAIPNDENAKVTFSNIDLVDGENTPVIITVVAENGEKQEYKLVINRLSEAESKVVIQNIVIEGYDFPFDVNVNTYDLTLKGNDNKLKISLVPNKNLEYDILNNENLVDGSTVIIRVNDDDDVEKTYKINIHKDIDTILGIKTDTFCYLVLGIGVLSLVSSILYVVLINKKKK